MKTGTKLRIRQIGGLFLGVEMILSAVQLRAQTQNSSLQEAVTSTGADTNQDQKIQQLQDQLERIEKELLELKRSRTATPASPAAAAISAAPAVDSTSTKASVPAVAVAVEQPASTDPHNPH